MSAQVEVEFTPSQDPETGKFNLLCNIIANEEIQEEIFLLRRIKTSDLTTDEDVNEFCGIANLTQLEDLPKNNPLPGEIFFLESSVTICFQRYSELQRAKQEIQIRINDLLFDYNDSAGGTFVTESVVIPSE